MNEIQKTNYTLKQEDKSISVYLDDKLVVKGFNDEESALHSIYVMNGSVFNHFYVVRNGMVSCVSRDCL
jgi:hypothetical protein